jgi:hypothetical protein
MAQRADDIVMAYRKAMGDYEKSKLAAHRAIETSNANAKVALEATQAMKDLMAKVEIKAIDAEVLTQVPAIS